MGRDAFYHIPCCLIENVFPHISTEILVNMFICFFMVYRIFTCWIKNSNSNKTLCA